MVTKYFYTEGYYCKEILHFANYIYDNQNTTHDLTKHEKLELAT